MIMNNIGYYWECRENLSNFHQEVMHGFQQ